jgi:hypothetical protein
MILKLMCIWLVFYSIYTQVHLVLFVILASRVSERNGIMVLLSVGSYFIQENYLLVTFLRLILMRIAQI